MRRTKRWLAMAMAVLITASTLAGDYMIATAAEVSVVDEVATEEAVEETATEQGEEKENPFEITVYQQPTEAPAAEPTQAPATQAPVVEESTEAPAAEETEAPAEEPTQAPTEEATEAPAEEPTQAPAEDATAAPSEEATEAPAEDASATPEESASPEESATPEETEEPTEDPTEETEEVEELEFSQSVVSGGMKISLYAKPGVLPNDAQLQVKKIGYSMENKIQEAIDAETAATVEDTFSFDINIYSESNNGFVQPEDGTVSVTFELLSVDTDDMAVSVYHVEENGKEVQNVEQVASAGVNADEVAFETEHFSVYTVVLTNNNKTAEVKISCFEVDGNGNHKSIGTDRRITLNNSSRTVEQIEDSLNISGYE